MAIVKVPDKNPSKDLLKSAAKTNAFYKCGKIDEARQWALVTVNILKAMGVYNG